MLLSYGASKLLHCATFAAALACRDIADDRYDVVIMRMGDPFDAEELPEGVIQRKVLAPATKESNGGGSRFGKLWLAEFREYASMVFIDHDVLVRRSLEPLFDLAEHLPGTLVAPRAYWIEQPYFTSGTFAISSGSDSHTHRAVAQLLHNHLNKWASIKWLGDMQWFNTATEIKDDATLISGFFSLLVGEFYPDDKIYSFWSKRFNWTSAQTFDKAYTIHFIASWKPWGKGLEAANGKITPELARAFAEWRALRKKVCVTRPDTRGSV